MLTYGDLHPYQRRAVEWMSDRRGGFIWLGMGDGKTAIAATSVAIEIASGSLRSTGAHAVIVGTKRIVEETWPRELEKWDHLSSLSYRSATGTKGIDRALSSHPDVIGVSYESLTKLLRHDNLPSFWIFDEISKMKSHSTQRFRTWRRWLGRNPTTRVFGLTATPAAEGHIGLWSQWKTVGGDDRLGRTVSEFRQIFCRERYFGTFSTYYVPERQQELIERHLAPDVFTIPDEERPYTPQAQTIDVAVPWSATGSKARYRRLERELLYSIERETFAVANRGVAAQKCRQMASGFVYDEDRTGHTIDEAKLEAVKEAVEELQGDPVLVFYQWEYERDQLVAALPGAEPMRDGAVGRFNAGEIPVLVLHPASCSHGLNLQGGRYAFFVSLPQSGEQYIQAVGRLDRQGQKRTPIVKRFLRSETVDEDTAALLDGKLSNELEMVQRMKERHRGST